MPPDCVLVAAVPGQRWTPKRTKQKNRWHTRNRKQQGRMLVVITVLIGTSGLTLGDFNKLCSWQNNQNGWEKI